MTSHLVLFFTCFFLFASPAAGAKVYWASDPVSPGETALVIGDGFAVSGALRLENLVDAATTSKPKVLLRTDQSLAVSIPSDWRPGIYRLTIGSGDEYASVLLNEPDIYWTQGDMGSTSSVGGDVRVFGRSIQMPGATARLRVITADKDMATISADTGDLWTARFILPQTLVAGDYRLEISNGAVGEVAWQPAGRLQIVASFAQYERRFKLADYGAGLDGRKDDTVALQAALDAASAAGGGVVALPPGRILAAGPLRIGAKVTMRGAGINATSLVFDGASDSTRPRIKGPGRYTIADLTIYSAENGPVVSDDSHESAAKGVAPTGGVVLERVRIETNGFRRVRRAEELAELVMNSRRKPRGGKRYAVLLGGADLKIVECEISGTHGTLRLSKAIRGLVARSILRPGLWGNVSLASSEGLIFEDNKIHGGDLLAVGIGVPASGPGRVSRNIYFARNEVRRFFGLDREGFTSDAGGGVYFGRVEAIDDRTFRLLDPVDDTGFRAPPEWRGLGFFVMHGPGRGQRGEVITQEDDVVRLARPLTVSANFQSLVTITWRHENYIVVDNYFEELGVALQFYGAAYNHVVANNTSNRTGGFSAQGRWYRHYQPAWYTQFLGNRVTNGTAFLAGPNNSVYLDEAVISLEGRQRAPNTAPLLLGGVLRRNIFDGDGRFVVRGGEDSENPGVVDSLVEGNCAPYSGQLQVDLGVRNIVDHNNNCDARQYK